ncbi:MAG: D-tyrosyl-tRNA(Tyr) deacylase [Bacteroidetes bacterium]|nr:D-tyrosyl-tRNA(Tyr) deacylase [Bacteroidota bacterium]
MRAVIQRVEKASVAIEGSETKEIEKGLLILLGIVDSDGEEDVQWLCKKISKLRIFDDENGVMNVSVTDIQGELMVISQFTLHASTKKGNRPSYIRASKPDIAIPLYEKFVKYLKVVSSLPVSTGQFGAYMKVSLVNDGPVTIIIDTKNKE